MKFVRLVIFAEPIKRQYDVSIPLLQLPREFYRHILKNRPLLKTLMAEWPNFALYMCV